MKPPKLEEFHERAGAQWAEAIESLGVGQQASATWNDLDAIEGAMRPFMGRGRNHAHLPTGGGMDFLTIGRSRERHCLEGTTDDKSADVFKPRSLILERFSEHPQESFLLLELQPLAATGVYKQDVQGQEELVDVPGKGYLRREVWDRGYLGLDEYEREIPLHEDARLISRWLSGKIMFVSKGSLWNSDPGTHDGRHSDMTATQLRAVIEASLAR